MNSVLIVDDDPRQQDDIRSAARKAGFSTDQMVIVATETDAEAALDRPFTLAVVDIMLTDPPGKEEGIRLIRAIKSRQPDCLIIALTTKAKQAAGVRALTAGACDFIQGDLDPAAIDWVSLLRHRIALWKAFSEEGAGV